MISGTRTNNFRISSHAEGSIDSIYLRQGANVETHLGVERQYGGENSGVDGVDPNFSTGAFDFVPSRKSNYTSKSEFRDNSEFTRVALN
jgi:hypothetical protein